MPADPNRVQIVFLAAVKLNDPSARNQYLDQICDSDAELRRRVDALLRAHDQPDGFLDEPLIDSANRLGAPDEEALSFLEPPQRPDSLGRIGHYEVLEILGRGGFGIVFRAFDEVLQRVVAVKVLAPEIAATSPARKRFLREARAAAQVRHENVVQVHAVVEQPLPFLVMEFVPGETLQQRLDRTGPLDAGEILGIGRQIASGLAAAHAQGLVHRDIKPTNVLVDGTGELKVKITDFGLARAADDASLTRSGAVAGTPMYMAPEQARGETLDHRADLFSLGSVLYVMASGRPPFRASNTMGVLKRVCDENPRPIREIIPETPDWLCRIIEKLHAKDPAERFQSASEAAELLADCESQLSLDEKRRDFTRIQPMPRRATVDWRPWIIIPVVLALFASFAGYVYYRLEFVPHPNVPDSAVMKALRQMAFVKANERDAAAARVKAQTAAPTELIVAEIAYLESLLKIADAERKRDEQIRLLTEILKQRQEERRLTELRISARVMPTSAINDIDFAIAEVQARLAKAKTESGAKP